jgi:hypothetical protein
MCHVSVCRVCVVVPDVSCLCILCTMCSVCIVITATLTAPPAGTSTEGEVPPRVQELAAGDNIAAPQTPGTRSARVLSMMCHVSVYRVCVVVYICIRCVMCLYTVYIV